MALSEKQKTLLQALEDSYYVILTACKRANIGRRTYYNWMEQTEFREKAEEIEKDLLTVIEDRLKTEALKRQPWAIRFFLSRRHPNYKPQHKVEISERPEFYFEEEEAS